MNDFELTDKQLLALQDMLQHYKEFQEELYKYPEPNTLFTQTQLDLFSLFDILWLMNLLIYFVNILIV